MVSKKAGLALKAVLIGLGLCLATSRALATNGEEGLDMEIERASSLCGTQDQKEGAAAFLEKRKPVFRGR